MPQVRQDAVVVEVARDDRYDQERLHGDGTKLSDESSLKPTNSYLCRAALSYRALGKETAWVGATRSTWAHRLYDETVTNLYASISRIVETIPPLPPSRALRLYSHSAELEILRFDNA
jgi:tryptophan synthase beta subunit